MTNLYDVHLAGVCVWVNELKSDRCCVGWEPLYGGEGGGRWVSSIGFSCTNIKKGFLRIFQQYIGLGVKVSPINRTSKQGEQ